MAKQREVLEKWGFGKYVKAGQVLVPRPENMHLYPAGYKHIVTVEEELNNGTLGFDFMIVPTHNK
jgi:hypothetical protein